MAKHSWILVDGKQKCQICGIFASNEPPVPEDKYTGCIPKTKQYYRFTEINDWEGETWHFYIPVKDNEEAIETLRIFIKDFSFEDMYEISNKRFPENEVDVLCDNSEIGYMAYHNILSGKLVLPELKVKDCHIVDDPFYKGGIENLME